MSERPSKIIVGLGNPGARYARTRHNLGFMVVDSLARVAGSVCWRQEGRSLVGSCEIESQEVVLAKPQTFMNLSGDAVCELLPKYQLGPESLLAILDDLNLPFGKIRIRESGSAGGHQGLESVLQAVQSEEVARVRLGIGEENMPDEKSEFVLADFPPVRQEQLEEFIIKARDAVKAVLAGGLSKAMSVYNA